MSEVSKISEESKNLVQYNKKERCMSFKEQKNASYKLRYLPSFYKKPPTEDKSKTFTCCICKEKLTDLTSFKVHLQKHEGAEDVVRNVCQKQFSTRKNTKGRTDVSFVCSICEKVLSSQRTLNKHLSIHCREKGVGYICYFCKAALQSLNSFENHIHLHTGETYECDICGKIFHSMKALKNHCSTHVEEKSLNASDISEEVLHSKQKLNHHVLTHAGGKPFKCKFCGMEFQARSTFYIHLRRHSGKNFACEFCEKKFIFQHLLKSHLRVHTGEKPYVCDICQESFRHKVSLNRHLPIHTERRFLKLDF